MKKHVWLYFAILIAALVAFACSGEKQETVKIDSPADRMKAQTSDGQMQAQVPSDQSIASSLDPSAITFTAMDIDGAKRPATQWIGKQPVVINFWGTWCPPCRREIPDLVKFYDEYKAKGLEIVSLAVNDNPDAVRAYAANAGMKWVMLMGDDAIYEKYGGIRGVPTTIFIDRNGKETARLVGARSYEDFKAAADKII